MFFFFCGGQCAKKWGSGFQYFQVLRMLFLQLCAQFALLSTNLEFLRAFYIFARQFGIFVHEFNIFAHEFSIFAYISCQ